MIKPIKEMNNAERVLVFLTTLCLLIGFAVALLQVFHKTQFDLDKVIVDYRGSPNPDLMAVPKSFGQILQNTHAHALSVPLVYFLLSWFFLATQATTRVKSTLITLLFISFLVDYSALWLLRYVHPHFIYASTLSHSVGSPIYLFMCLKVMWEVFRERQTNGTVD